MIQECFKHRAESMADTHVLSKIEETPNMSMKDVHLLVNDKFNVDYSLKQIGKIVKKLGYNYSKAYPKFSKSPEDAEEQLKKT